MIIVVNDQTGAVIKDARVSVVNTATGDSRRHLGRLRHGHINNDRPLIDGVVLRKSAFRGTATSDVAAFVEKRFRFSESRAILLRLEGFNLFQSRELPWTWRDGFRYQSDASSDVRAVRGCGGNFAECYPGVREY